MSKAFPLAQDLVAAGERCWRTIQRIVEKNHDVKLHGQTIRGLISEQDNRRHEKIKF